MGDLYFVVGGISSGTRLATRLLLAAGCAGDGNHEQLFDWEIKPGYDKIVWRRSVPHSSPESPDRWPDLKEMAQSAKNANYRLKWIIITHRNWDAASHSAARRRASVPDVKTALEYNEQAYLDIFKQTKTLLRLYPKARYVMCSYDQLVATPKLYGEWLIKHIGLEFIKTPEEIFNSNLTYYRKKRDEEI